MIRHGTILRSRKAYILLFGFKDAKMDMFLGGLNLIERIASIIVYNKPLYTIIHFSL
jgi:hypothetical protein